MSTVEAAAHSLTYSLHAAYERSVAVGGW